MSRSLSCVSLLAAAAALPASAIAADTTQWLDDHGIAPRLVWSNDYARNVDGGLSRGDRNAGGVVAGADLDLQRLFGIPGATLHATGAWYYGDSLSQRQIGNGVKVQGYWYPQQQAQLAQLTWEQSFADGRWQLVAGRMNTTWQFARSRYGCRFVSASDCPFQLSQADGGFVGFPYVNWGAKLRYKPEATYVSVGAFELNPQRKNNHGLDWSTADSTGVLGVLEVGYEPDPARGKGAPRYLAGLWYNSADYSDLRYNQAGGLRGLVGGPARLYDGGRWGAYALGERALYRPQGMASKRILVAFGNIAAPFDKHQVYDLQVTAGLYYSGPFAARPGDGMGAIAHYYRFSADQQGYMNDLLRKRGAAADIARNELIFELNYSYRIAQTPLFLVPNVQYIVHPDILGNPAARRAPDDALVIGLRVMLNMGGLGTPK
ncbi:carbohydrate porin [uncultured Xanthomonas sp.]|uniref:carbohydrate porin n=1 Tax=uncultured Xanthomonas sp. TaxID=152831 RepID=UPI0025D41517|nr:carbohydrate porin [uncultured Xanthomonas sp.]